MDTRKMYLTKLHEYIEGVDKEVTMILQSLQWDRKKLLEGKATTSCKYDSGHRVPVEKLDLHEQECKIKSLGYSKADNFLPDPPDSEAKTVVKLSSEDINSIINMAALKDPMFQRGERSQSNHSEPLSLERLQVTYTPDERRAIHDAVVNAVPSSHDLSDLALTSTNGEDNKPTSQKSRLEILSELRDMKRRRTKYRVAAKTKNYSDVLRDVIKTQMEMYSETQKAKSHNNDDKNTQSKLTYTNNKYKDSTKNDPRDNETHNKYKREYSRVKEINEHDNYKKHKPESLSKNTPKHYNEEKVDTSKNYKMEYNRNAFKKDDSDRRHNSDDRREKYKYLDKRKEREVKYSEVNDRRRHGDYKRDENYDKSRREKFREESTSSSSRREYRDSKRKSDSSSRKCERKAEEKPRRYYDTYFKDEY